MKNHSTGLIRRWLGRIKNSKRLQGVGLGLLPWVMIAAYMNAPSGPGIAVYLSGGGTAARSIAAGDGIAVTNGDGTGGNPTVAVSVASQAQGDLLTRGASDWGRLAPGTSGYFLKSAGPGAAPTYSTIDVTTSAVTGTLPLAKGGTNATGAADARTQLGVAAKAGDTYGSGVHDFSAGEVRSARLWVHHAGSYGMTAADCKGAVHDNLGATGTITLTLPAWAAGLDCVIYLETDADVIVAPSGSDQILALTLAGGERVQSPGSPNRVMSYLELQASTSGVWAPMGHGTWTRIP